VAVAHHRDDNVETVLHHIVRGTGLQGLAGVPRIRQLTGSLTLIRPLLDVGRTDIMSFLGENGSDYLEDPSNSDVVFTRNRIRNELIPTLESDFNPQLRSAIHRLSNQARDAHALVTRYATSLLHRTCEIVNTSEVRVRCDLLREEPPAAIRAMMVRVWTEQEWPRKKMGFAEWESLSELVLGQSIGCGRDLPGGVNAARKKATLTLRLGSES
jgi:tRNA(Ile)-lysidine synthase